MKTAKIFLAIIFIMAISFGVKAQDKYEYATVIQSLSTLKKGFLDISIGDKFETKEIQISEGSLIRNTTQILSEVNKMGQEGWEVYSNNIIGDGTRFIFYLRKKKA